MYKSGVRGEWCGIREKRTIKGQMMISISLNNKLLVILDGKMEEQCSDDVPSDMVVVVGHCLPNLFNIESTIICGLLDFMYIIISIIGCALEKLILNIINETIILLYRH